MKTNCKCNYCGADLYKLPNQIRKYKTHFCNNTCASRSRSVKETRQCLVCGKGVTRKPSEFTGNVFCSRDCYHHYDKTSKRKTTNKVDCVCSYCGNSFKRYPSQIKDKKYTYCNMKCKDKHNGELLKGENHHRWDPNLTEELRLERRKCKEYLDWREEVYRRDKYRCQCCGDDKGGNLVAHHILNFSEHEKLRTAISNGITLCDVCHKEFHDNYGYTNNNQKQLEEFLQRYANQLPTILVTE
jgi:hypothetical protein